MGKDRDAIKTIARQLLNDEIPSSGEDPDIKPDVLDIHIDQTLSEVSEVSPYIDRETVVSDGTRDISLSAIENLIGDKVEKVEYPVGSDPPDYIHDFSIFGATLRLNADTPTSGQNIYLYCQKVHTLTKATSTLTADLERVLIQGVVAYAALAWLNNPMRAQIAPASSRWYHDWANNHYGIYQKGLKDIAPAKAWEF